MHREKIPIVEIVGAILLATVGFTILLILFPYLGSTDVAAWVQAVGSIVAIGVAIWVADRQSRYSRDLVYQRDQEEMKNKLLAIASEINVHARAITDMHLQFVRASTQKIHVTFPVSTPIFPVYESCAGALGMVEDMSVRVAIIDCYAEIRSLFDTVNRNTEVVLSLDFFTPMDVNVRDELDFFQDSIPTKVMTVLRLHDLIQKKLATGIRTIRFG